MAVETFEYMLNLSPDNTLALASLVEIYLSKKDRVGAIQRVQKQVKITPDNAGNLMLLGNLYVQDNRPEEALALFKKAQELVPNAPQPYLLSAKLLKELGKSEEAMAEYQELIAQQPTFLPPFLGLAALQEQAGDTSQAMDTYKKILEIDEKNVVAANNLAWLIANEENGDLGEAMRLALIAKDKYPDDPSITNTLGWIHYKRKSYDLALSQFEQAVTAQPDMPSFRYYYALGLRAKGRMTEAKEELQKCLEKDIDFPERQEAEKLLKNWI
jgi:tetratricopeptide (TPR) repeat protein